MSRCAAVIAACLLAPSAAAELRPTTFASKALGRDVAAVVQLPPSYEKSPGRRFPYVIALHGLFESPSFWERRGLSAVLDRMWAEGRLPEFVLVAIDGGNSFFVNSPAGRFEDLVTQDALAWTEATFRVHKGREARGLWGVSMGGYAALRIAFTHPDTFFAVATHSAMLLEAIPTREQGAGRWQMDAFFRVFGDPIDSALWAKNDPLKLAAGAATSTLPALRFDCGAQDRYGLAHGNAALHHVLEARGVRHEFATPPGDHGYEYVLTVAEAGLRFLGSNLTLKAAR